MKTNYPHTILTGIALLLCAILAQLVHSNGAGPWLGLVKAAYAQGQEMTTDVLIFPVGNQDVRKWVVFDRRTNMLYKYDGGGDLEESWTVGRPGEKFQKQR
jgi:hypothetical protein